MNAIIRFYLKNKKDSHTCAQRLVLDSRCPGWSRLISVLALIIDIFVAQTAVHWLWSELLVFNTVLWSTPTSCTFILAS